MRVTICWFGYELDFSLGPVSDDEPEFEPFPDAGYTVSTPIGFTLPPIPWDADGPVHQFDPDESTEDQ